MIKVTTGSHLQKQPARCACWFTWMVFVLVATTFRFDQTASVVLAAETSENDSGSDFEELAKTFIQQREKFVRLQSERQFLDQELNRYEAITRFRTEKSLLDGFSALPPDSPRQLLFLLEQLPSPRLALIATADGKVE